MANQKTYNIVINGINESIANVDKLLKQLDALESKISTLSKSGNVKIGIGADVSSVKQVTELTQEQLIAQEKIKQEQKEQRQLAKDIAQGIRDESGAYTETLGGMRKELSAMKKELSTMDVKSEGFGELKNNIKVLNDQILDIEKSYGTFTRQVGNYELIKGGVDGASNSFANLRSEIDELSNNPINLNIGDAEVQFENTREATRLLNGELNELAAQMYALKQSGQESTEEFQKLQQRFNDVASAADELDHITAYSNRMKQSIMDDSGAVGELARNFEAFNSIAQVGTGLMGIFGQKNEEAAQAINRTVQIMTTLKGVQELVNKQFQQGAPLMNIWNKAVGAVSSLTKGAASGNALLATSLTAEGVAATEATVATTAFDTALAATGIGAIVILIGSAVGYLVTNFDDLKEEFEELYPEFASLANEILPPVMNALKAFGKVVVDSVLAPLHGVAQFIQSLKEGKGVLESFFGAELTSLKKQYGSILEIGDNYSNLEKKRLNKEIVDKKKKYSEELKALIDLNVAKYGNDWKYSEQGLALQRKYWSQRVAIAREGSREELNAAMIEQAEGERGITEHNNAFAQQQAQEANQRAQAAAQEAKQRAQEARRNAEDAEKDIWEAKMKLMKDGIDKELLQLDYETKEQLNKIKERGVKVEELTRLVTEQYNQERNKIIDKYNQELISKYQDVQNKIEGIINSSSTNRLDAVSNAKYLLEQDMAYYRELINNGISPLNQ